MGSRGVRARPERRILTAVGCECEIVVEKVASRPWTYISVVC